MTSESLLLKLYFLNDKCFVWNAKDARTLREDHRIVGTLVGCLPRAPHQNVHLGLPVELMPEEVTLLLNKGLAEVVAETYREPTEDDVMDLKEQRRDSHHHQVELFRNERREVMKRKLPEIIEGKKVKRNKLLEQRRKYGEEIDDAKFTEEIEIDPETFKIPAIKEDHALVQLHLELQLRERTTCKAVDWRYPSSSQEKLRCHAFRDLWEKGHFLTSGSKFGGDFLVYPGDPARFHSFYVAVCKPHKHQMTALDLVTMGRLGSNVKKTVVVCSEDDNGRMCYTSLQWTGIS